MNKLRNELKNITIYLEMETDQLKSTKDIKPFKMRMENVIGKLNEIENKIWLMDFERGIKENE